MGTFLSAKEIIEAVDGGELRIAYYSIKKPSGEIVHIGEKRFVLPEAKCVESLDKDIRKYFLTCVEPDSIAFHVGPYASVETLKGSRQRQFIISRGNENVFNVKESGKLLLFPGEFILVGSNEYVETSAKIGASLYSNVRNTDIGLSHISTMIDPSWKGKLQIGISNPTRYTKKLDYLDEVCIIRFHRLDAEPPAEIIDRFRDRRPHFGNDWWSIEKESGRKFFPIRREYSAGGEAEKGIRTEKIKQKLVENAKIIGTVFGAGVLASGAYFVAKLSNRLEDFSTYPDRLQAVESGQKRLDEINKTFHVIRSGTASLSTIENKRASFPIAFGEELASPPTVLLGIVGLDSSSYEVGVKYSMSGSRDSKYMGAVVTVTFREKPSEIRPPIATWLVASPKPSAK